MDNTEVRKEWEYNRRNKGTAGAIEEIHKWNAKVDESKARDKALKLEQQVSNSYMSGINSAYGIVSHGGWGERDPHEVQAHAGRYVGRMVNGVVVWKPKGEQ